MSIAWFLKEVFQVLVIELAGVAALTAILYGYVKIMSRN